MLRAVRTRSFDAWLSARDTSVVPLCATKRWCVRGRYAVAARHRASARFAAAPSEAPESVAAPATFLDRRVVAASTQDWGYGGPPRTRGASTIPGWSISASPVGPIRSAGRPGSSLGSRTSPAQSSNLGGPSRSTAWQEDVPARPAGHAGSGMTPALRRSPTSGGCGPLTPRMFVMGNTSSDGAVGPSLVPLGAPLDGSDPRREIHAVRVTTEAPT
jgi:hypothetical protein